LFVLELWYRLTSGKTVNGRALLILIAGVVVGGAGLFFLHRFQVRRNAEGVYEQAKIAESKGDKVLAAHYLQQFLGMEPSHTEALAQLAVLLNEQATSDRARTRVFLMFEQVLRRDAERHDLRREVVRLASRLGRFNDGLEHLNVLTADPAKADDAELLQLRGRCQAGLHDYQNAANSYKKALAKGPPNPEIALEYAFLLRGRMKQTSTADSVVEQMVARDKRSLDVRLKAASYFGAFGMPKRAWDHVEFALNELKPPTADLLQLAGDVASSLGEPEQARKLFEQGRQLFPDDERMNRGLAEIELRAGDTARALALLKRTFQDLPKDPVEIWRIADGLARQGSIAEAKIIRDELHKRGAAGLVALLDARFLMHDEAWGDALKLLERARLSRHLTGGFEKYGNLLAAECADRLLNPDLRLEALKRAVDLDPNWLEGAVAHAKALAATGKLDLAITELRRLAADAPSAKEDLARLLAERTRRLPAPQRNWSEVKALLDDLPTESRERLETKLFRAEIALLEGDRAAARAQVQAERDRDPKQAAPWLFLIGLEERDAPAAALKLVDQAERRVGPRADWQIARLRLGLRAGPAEGRTQVAKTLDTLDDYFQDDESGVQNDSLRKRNDQERNRLLDALAGASAALGEAAEARRLWNELAQRTKGNLGVWLALFDGALEAKDAEEAGTVLARIRKLEGGDGPHTACSEAALLLSGPKAAEKEVLAEARKHLARARTARPNWARVPLLEAAIFEREGQEAQALEKYKAAIERGEGRLSVVQRTVQLMNDQKDFGGALALLQKLPEQALATPGLGRLAANAILQTGADRELAVKQALETARKAVANSKKHKDFVWLGQMAALAGEKAEAEKALRRAVELAPSAPEVRWALVTFLARHDAKQAEAEMEIARTKLIRNRHFAAIGACYEALGKLPQAEENYLAALNDQPHDILVLRNTAGFYGRTGQFAKAEPLLRQCLDLPAGLKEPHATWARRNLALALTFQGGYQRLQEAQTLLGSNLKMADTPEDQLIKALTLATHPSHRKDAIESIEQARRTKELPADFRLMLAQLYEADGDWTKARSELLDLAGGNAKNPVVLTQLVRALLRNGKAAEAAPWTEKLAAVAPGKPETIDLQVQVLKSTGAKQQAVALVNAYAQTKDARLDVAARWLEVLDEPAAAEKHLRALAATSKRPESVLDLAMFLGRHKRLPEALALCEQAYKTCRPEAVASAGITLLRLGEPSAEMKQQVERGLLQAIRDNPKARALPLLLSELYDLRGDHDRAIAILRDMLKQDVKNVVILNNLAYLVAVRQGDTAGALPLIDEAIKIAGPVDELLDTRASVYLKKLQPELAVKDLQQALAQAPTATRYFHLAQAQQMIKDRDAAATALRKALDMGLQPAQVHPLEREAFKQLVAELSGT
jgi:cellulose synthase operon protein C